MIENGQQHEQFEQRCVQLAKEFGVCVVVYDELPEQYKSFFEIIGYVRVCSLLVVSELQRGRSETQVARRYGLTRAQVRNIKTNSRACRQRV